LIWINATQCDPLPDEGFDRRVLMSSNPAMTWYVSFIAGDNLSDDRAHRATKTFAGEHEAKKFARAKFEAGDRTLVAGTINPVTPKRVIPSASIPDWLDEAVRR
jgi:hypothetical protein